MTVQSGTGKSGGRTRRRARALYRRILSRAAARPLAALIVAFVLGVIFWGGFNWSLELANTQSFCVSCHVMRANIFGHFKKTGHFANRTGVRATCPDCHVPRKWHRKVIRKITATNELFHWFAGSIDTPEKFDARRGKLARHVWKLMEKSDSRECRNCHSMAAMAAKAQQPMARQVHKLARRWKLTCINCHQGIAHILPGDFDKGAVLDSFHDRIKAEGIKCWTCHEDMARAPEDDRP